MTSSAPTPRDPFLPASLDEVPAWAQEYRAGDFAPYAYTADVLELAVDLDGGTLRGLVVERGQPPYRNHLAWPGGFVEWNDHNASDAGLREVSEETGHSNRPSFFETLDTYDANGRDPRQFAGHFDRGLWIATGARVVSKAFVALFAEPSHQPRPRAGQDARAAHWESVYRFLPWEDLRSADGRASRREIVRALTERWVQPADTRDESLRRKRRLDTTFGGADLKQWNEERTAERYTLLLETGLITEARRDEWGDVPAGAKRHVLPGDTPLAFDHRRMLADALGRLRGKMKYTPSVIAALIGSEITTSVIHRVCEALSGRPIHLANLRRLMTETHPLLHPVKTTTVGPRPAGRQPIRYRWMKDVELLRLDPAMRMPWAAIPAR